MKKIFVHQNRDHGGGIRAEIANPSAADPSDT